MSRMLTCCTYRRIATRRERFSLKSIKKVKKWKFLKKLKDLENFQPTNSKKKSQNISVVQGQIFNRKVSFFLSAFLWNFFLRLDCLSGDVPPQLAQPCYVALGRALFLILSNRYCNSERDLNLRPKHLLYLNLKQDDLDHSATTASCKL